MKHETDEPDVEPHVFDQTNGLVDLGPDGPERRESGDGRVRSQTVGGIAMLSANRPAG
ncbi:hypothetical protein [Amnibacterium sp.]|uniref:hypothetical protein n=1 Tax=Amnibacterium sp. TaxID=1872496 RepID=UPI00262C3A6F|nr:hypothetical protein [Amnibacterium sp.]MCU1472016.1 hypothetical protein [Amnibacterium sp.]